MYDDTFSYLRNPRYVVQRVVRYGLREPQEHDTSVLP